MSRRVLVVVSSYAPAMNADMHRARHLGWELEEFGWNMEILSPSAAFQQPNQIESDGGDFFSNRTPLHFVGGESRAPFNFFSIHSVGWRALLPMYRAGMRLLRSGRFDLVYFSTTNFPLLLLGPLWRMWSDIPYIIDIHDPIYKSAETQSSARRSGLKHWLANWLAKFIEALSTNGAAGLISVSPVYEQLRVRYGRDRTKPPGPQAVIPFAVQPRDHRQISDGMRPPADPRRFSIVYVGAGGSLMERSFMLLCNTLAAIRKNEPALVEPIRIELYGTQSKCRDGEGHLRNVARRSGLGDLVSEFPDRIAYRRSLEILHGADGVIVLGVDERAYMPSKLFSYAFSGKPLLAIVRKDGPAYTVLARSPNLGGVLWFDGAQEMPGDGAIAILRKFLCEVESRIVFDRSAELKEFTACAMARRHVEFFEEVLGRGART